MTTDNAGQSDYGIDIKDELPSKIQKGAMQILGFLLNGGFSKKGLLLFPLCSNIDSGVFDQIRDILDACKIMHHRDGSFRKSAFFANKYKVDFLTEKTVAKFLEAVYKDLADWVVNYDLNLKEEKIKFLQFNKSDYSNKFLSPVIRLRNYANEELSDVLYSLLVHGSLSTLDYVKGWSDFDTFIILKETSLNYQKLMELHRKIYKSRKYLYQIDPLQHHGHFIVTETDLQFYPNSFIPTVVLEKAKPLFGPSEMKLKKRYDKAGVLRNFENMCKSIEEHSKITNPNIYQIKQFYHYVLLFPCLFLQSIGKPTYKKESFENTKPYFRAHIWEVIEDISKVRANWNPSYIEKLYVNTYWNPILGRVISNKLFSHNPLIKRSKEYMQHVERAKELYAKGLEIIKTKGVT